MWAFASLFTVVTGCDRGKPAPPPPITKSPVIATSPATQPWAREDRGHFVGRGISDRDLWLGEIARNAQQTSEGAESDAILMHLAERGRWTLELHPNDTAELHWEG